MAKLEQSLDRPEVLEKLCKEGTSGACALLGREAMVMNEVPVLQGVTSNSQARFVILAPKNDRLAYFVRGPNKTVRLHPERYFREFSPLATDQIEAFELDPAQSYELLVLGPDGTLWDKRQFRALDLNKKNARLAIVSCQDDSLKNEMKAMGAQLIAEKPDAILMIGDNVYADHLPGGWQLAAREQLWNRYVDTRSVSPLFRAKTLVPVFATWDDHDYGRNDSDRTNPGKEEAFKVFRAFFDQAHPGPSFETGPGVASVWKGFGLRFLMLDDRTFRSPNRVDLPDQTHFGPQQEEWILLHLNAAREPVFMISGDQFFGAYHPFESYQGNQPKSFAQQLPRWKNTARVPVIFVSGDRHLTEIIKVPKQAMGYPTYELTSSPLHSSVFAGALAKNPNPNQLVGKDGIQNYMIVTVLKAEPKRVDLDVQSYTMEHKLVYQKKLTVKK